jgi:hypothetical protein
MSKSGNKILKIPSVHGPVLTAKQIASRLGVPVATVNGMVRRAVDSIREPSDEYLQDIRRRSGVDMPDDQLRETVAKSLRKIRGGGR